MYLKKFDCCDSTHAAHLPHICNPTEQQIWGRQYDEFLNKHGQVECHCMCIHSKDQPCPECNKGGNHV